MPDRGPTHDINVIPNAQSLLHMLLKAILVQHVLLWYYYHGFLLQQVLKTPSRKSVNHFFFVMQMMKVISTIIFAV